MIAKISGEPVQAAPGVQLVARSWISVNESILPYNLNSSRNEPAVNGEDSPKPILILRLFEFVRSTGFKAVTLPTNTPSTYPSSTSVALL